MTSEDLITAKEGITLEEAKKILAKARIKLSYKTTLVAETKNHHNESKKQN